MGLHIAEGTGAVAVALVGPWRDRVALGAVADAAFAAGGGVGDDLGVFLVVVEPEEDCSRGKVHHRRLTSLYSVESISDWTSSITFWSSLSLATSFLYSRTKLLSASTKPIGSLAGSDGPVG